VVLTFPFPSSEMSHILAVLSADTVRTCTQILLRNY
jgi:hypothetical protein